MIMFNVDCRASDIVCLSTLVRKISFIFSQHELLRRWKVEVMPAKSVSAADIHFPHAMHPQHHVPLPSSVISLKFLKKFLGFFQYKAD